MFVVVKHFLLSELWLRFSLAELLVGGERRLNVAVVPANASSLLSLVMVCNSSRSFSSATCILELFFNLHHVADISTWSS